MSLSFSAPKWPKTFIPRTLNRPCECLFPSIPQPSQQALDNYVAWAHLSLYRGLFFITPRFGESLETRNRRGASSITTSWLSAEKPFATTGRGNCSPLKTPNFLNFPFNSSKAMFDKVTSRGVEQLGEKIARQFPLLSIWQAAGKDTIEGSDICDSVGFTIASTDLPPIMMDYLYSMDDNLKAE
ncbi:unnamed protein product [Prunus armeniaca]